MNCDSWLVPKNSFDRHVGRILIRVCGVSPDVLGGHPPATTRSMQDRPTDLVLDQLAHGAQTTVAEVVMSSTSDGHLDATGAVMVAGTPVSAASCRRTRYSMVATMSSGSASSW